MKKEKVIFLIFYLLYTGLSGLNAQTVKDIDGNVYKTVTIGTQTWMAENLKTIKLNDGNPITLITNDVGWMKTPACFWYNNDETAYKNKYGALYNWYTVNTKKLCPEGWHVPTFKEWTILANYLGGDSISGGKLKEIGTTHWISPNTGATNETEFTALPGGERDPDGRFSAIGYFGSWWSSTVSGTDCGWMWNISYDNNKVVKFGFNMLNGYSVRCVKGEIKDEDLNAGYEANIIETFSDPRDGKTYKMVKIGTQTWMAQNLCFKSNKGSWAYEDDEKYSSIYGYLYDWETAKNVCPTGWRLPSDAEWTTLATSLGGDSVAGGKMKVVEFPWLFPNTDATNSSGFSGLPSGERDNGKFYAMTRVGGWWTSTEENARRARNRALNYDHGILYHNSWPKKDAISVRCVKN